MNDNTAKELIHETSELLKAFKHYIAISVGLTIAGIWIGNVDVLGLIRAVPSWSELPVNLRIVIIGVPSGLALTYITFLVLKGSGKIDWLTEPNWVDLYEVDEARPTSPQTPPDEFIAHWKVAPKIFKRKIIEAGLPYESDHGHWTAQKVTHDKANNVIRLEGVWAGEYTDVELAGDRWKLEAQRQKTRKWAIVGQNLYHKLIIITEELESAYWRALDNEELDERTLNPDIVRSSVVDEVDQYVESIDVPNDKEHEEEVKKSILESTLDDAGIDIPEKAEIGSEGDGQ